MPTETGKRMIRGDRLLLFLDVIETLSEIGAQPRFDGRTIRQRLEKLPWSIATLLNHHAMRVLYHGYDDDPGLRPLHSIFRSARNLEEIIFVFDDVVDSFVPKWKRIVSVNHVSWIWGDLMGLFEPIASGELTEVDFR